MQEREVREGRKRKEKRKEERREDGAIQVWKSEEWKENNEQIYTENETVGIRNRKRRAREGLAERSAHVREMGRDTEREIRGHIRHRGAGSASQYLLLA